LDNKLPTDVQMQYMRPAQLEAALRAFPAVYVPFGLIEWHGLHLPLGTDALKAHAILIKCAERFGGVVYPPVYFFDGFGRDLMEPLLTRLFEGIRKTGARVIMGVSGHGTRGQIEMINVALSPVLASGEVAGEGLFEPTLSECDECGGDHAAKWETSSMMFFNPQFVNISELGDGPLAPDMKPPDGIGGLDPREHASAEVGQRAAELTVDAIAHRAQELLASLPEDKRAFSLPVIRPGHWFVV